MRVERRRRRRRRRQHARVSAFLRYGLDEQLVTLDAPSRHDAADYEFVCAPQQVRLVRDVAPNGKVRVLMSNFFDTGRFPASTFGDLHHMRWRIEEAFKRLKHRLNLKHVSCLSQQAVAQNIAAKIMCDKLKTLATLSAHEQADLRAVDRIKHAYAHTALKPAMPTLLFGKKVPSTCVRCSSYLANTLTFIEKINRCRANPDRNRTNSYRKNHADQVPIPKVGPDKRGRA